jgi:uncharacterized LabA/DUF88 family protein
MDQKNIFSHPSDERVCVFIDNTNLFGAMRSMHSGPDAPKLDYRLLRDYFGDDGLVDVRFYYSEPDSPLPSELPEKRAGKLKFYESLARQKFIMVKLPLRSREVPDRAAIAMVDYLRRRHDLSDEKILQIVKQGRGWLKQIETGLSLAEKGLDCEIVFDMARLAYHGRYDRFILVAGDEDYARTVHRLRTDVGMAVEVAFFPPPRCSAVLVRQASGFINLLEIQGLLAARGQEQEVAV